MPHQNKPPVPEEIQLALRDYLHTVINSKEPQTIHFCGNGRRGEDQPIMMAVQLGNPSEDLIEKVIIAAETVGDTTRSDIVKKLKEMKAYDALDRVGRKYMHDTDREKHWVAAQAFISRDNYTPETARYLIDETISGKSPRTELLFHFENTVNILFRNADATGRLRLKKFANAKGWIHLTEKQDVLYPRYN